MAHGLGIVPQSKSSPVLMPGRACAWVAGQVPGGAGDRKLIGVSLIYQYFSPSLSPSLLLSLKVNKYNLLKQKQRKSELLVQHLTLNNVEYKCSQN